MLWIFFDILFLFQKQNQDLTQLAFRNGNPNLHTIFLHGAKSNRRPRWVEEEKGEGKTESHPSPHQRQQGTHFGTISICQVVNFLPLFLRETLTRNQSLSANIKLFKTCIHQFQQAHKEKKKKEKQHILWSSYLTDLKLEYIFLFRFRLTWIKCIRLSGTIGNSARTRMNLY